MWFLFSRLQPYHSDFYSLRFRYLPTCSAPTTLYLSNGVLQPNVVPSAPPWYSCHAPTNPVVLAQRSIVCIDRRRIKCCSVRRSFSISEQQTYEPCLQSNILSYCRTITVDCSSICPTIGMFERCTCDETQTGPSQWHSNSSYIPCVAPSQSSAVLFLSSLLQFLSYWPSNPSSVPTTVLPSEPSGVPSAPPSVISSKSPSLTPSR